MSVVRMQLAILAGLVGMDLQAVPGNEPGSLRLAIVQMAISPEIEANCQHMLALIAEAGQAGARVVVFPEGALWTEIPNQDVQDQCTQAIDGAARRYGVYVIYGECKPGGKPTQLVQSMRLVNPRGETVFRYTKHYSDRNAPLPDTFLIDGVAASGIICADRWLRTIEELPIQKGARLSFELSANYEEEWVPSLEWYWYVSRAIRNSVWVIFANSAQNAHCRGHGHSAVIAPDGKIVAAVPDNRECILYCDIDPRQATGSEAVARANHPSLADFWKKGLALLDGQLPEDLPISPEPCGKKELGLAASGIVGDVDKMRRAISEANTSGADLIAFPARACLESELPLFQSWAKEHSIYIALGIIPQAGTMNQAVVIDPDGRVITRYGQLSALAPFCPGQEVGAMLFRIKGVLAILSLERDILWTELMELAAIRGVQVLVHLDHCDKSDSAARQRRLQMWTVASSFGMVSVVADRCQPSIFEDLNARAERRAVIDGVPTSHPPMAKIHSPFSANLLVSGSEGDLVVARRQLPEVNPYYSDRVQRYPALARWLKWGTQVIFGRQL